MNFILSKDCWINQDALCLIKTKFDSWDTLVSQIGVESFDAFYSADKDWLVGLLKQKIQRISFSEGLDLYSALSSHKSSRSGLSVPMLLDYLESYDWTAKWRDETAQLTFTQILEIYSIDSMHHLKNFSYDDLKILWEFRARYLEGVDRLS
jgi:hypothetical protein